jgi:hypothetical protein
MRARICGVTLSDACRRSVLHQQGWGAPLSCLDFSALALRRSSTFQNIAFQENMHLLNTSTLKLEYFIKTVPHYAILSHTWNEDEITFDDIDKPHIATIKGYKKVSQSCRQALKDGYKWIWVDTCCIDKRSSAELSEAINSMYDWYWRAEICYVYLEDVPLGPLVESKWFHRGWFVTLVRLRRRTS